MPKGCGLVEVPFADLELKYIVFVPAKDDEKPIASLTARLFPEPDAEEAPTLIEHWLFCSFLFEPATALAQVVVSLLASQIRLLPRS